MDTKRAAFQLLTADKVMDGRLSASPEYAELVDAIAGLNRANGERWDDLIDAEINRRATPIMRELARVRMAERADWDRHDLRYGVHATNNTDRAVRRIRKALAA